MILGMGPTLPAFAGIGTEKQGVPEKTTGPCSWEKDGCARQIAD
jgi:hypothetical protein